jgi:hypothetical protein
MSKREIQELAFSFLENSFTGRSHELVAMSSLQELPEEMQVPSKTRQPALVCRVVGRVEAIEELPENEARRAIPNTIAKASPIS